MKILKIFGLVVAVHAIAFVVIFANPGCRSTSSANAEPIAAASPAPYSGGDESVPVTPVTMDEPAPQPVVTYSPAPDGRFAPTRPSEVTDSSAEVIPASAYTVQRGDSLWTIARKNGISVAELAAANNIKQNSPLQIGQKLLVPSKGIAGKDSTSPTAGGTKTYTVKSGDTLSTIATRNGTTIAAIRSANDLRSDIVRVGQELKIPDGSSTHAPAPKTTITTTAPAPSGATTHVVKMGDTLEKIARRYKVSVTSIAKANNITDPTRILIGQELMIPAPGSPATSSTVSTSTPPPPAPAATTPGQTTPGQTTPASPGDLDSALPPDFIDAPVIQVEKSGAPEIE